MNKLEDLKKIADLTFEKLNIPKIPINVKYVANPCKITAYFDMENLEISTYLFDDEFIVEHGYLDKELNNVSNWEKSLFILFHEIGHYLHFTKYRKHYDRLWKIYIPESSNKMEVIANKVAHILLNELEK